MLALLDSALLGLDPNNVDLTSRALTLQLALPWSKVDGARSTAPQRHQYAAVYPGSFDPPHRGHVQVVRAAAESLRCDVAEVVMQIEVAPPHKAALSPQAVARRTAWLRRRGFGVWLTAGAPTYLDKAALSRNKTIVVGADAFANMLNRRWCDDPRKLMHSIWQHGVEILVVPRSCQTAGSVWSDVVGNGLPENVFALRGDFDDVSSSQIRGQASSALSST